MTKRSLALTGMILFLTFFYSFLFLASRANVRHEAAGLSKRAEPLHEETRLTPEKIKEKEARFKQNLLSRPRLLSAVSMAMLLVLLCGLIVEGLWLARLLDNQKIFLGPPPAAVPAPAWGIGDVGSIFVALFFVEAVLLAVELMMATRVHFGPAMKDFLTVFNGLIRNICVALGVIFLVTRIRKQPLAALGLSRQNWPARAGQGLVAYLGAVPLLLALLLLVAGLANFFSYDPPVQAAVELYLKKSTGRFLVFFTLFVAAVGPIIEEIFFRGFAYPALRARFGAAAAMMGTAFVFSALHMSVAAFLPIFFLGLFLAYLYEKTGSLIPSMTAHMVHNTIMVGLTIGFKALSS